MVGETLPAHWTWNCIFCDNFPVSSTHIPINTMEQGSDHVNHHLRSGFKSEHSGGGINALIADGGVHWLNESIDYATYNMLGSRANADVPPSSPF